MAVPASFNDIAADAAVRDHVGDVWYQTTVRVPRGWDGQRIVLHFESATHRATVWVNDAEVVSHEGGYTPFEAEVTEHVQAGERGPDHRRGQQHPQLPVDPAGRHRGHPGRQAPALLPRLLQLRRPPPPGVAVRDRPSPPHRRHRRHRPGWRQRLRRVPDRGRRDADGAEVRVVLRDADGAEVATGTGASGTPHGGERPPVGPGRRLPVRPRGPAGRRRRRAPGQLPPERRRAHRGRGRHHGSSSTASRSTSPASASTRTWP